jgi:hypothetical protein
MRDTAGFISAGCLIERWQLGMLAEKSTSMIKLSRARFR